jgi:hypothetical protein
VESEAWPEADDVKLFRGIRAVPRVTKHVC